MLKFTPAFLAGLAAASIASAQVDNAVAQRAASLTL